MKSMLNPEDYIITRKRKKYKFAKFANSPICFEFDEWQKQGIDIVELGAGDGLFLVELAAKNPDRKFLAIDVKGDRLQKGAYEAEARGIKNILFLRARADQIDEILDEGSLAELWLTFSDPFPKARSAGRRMTHNNFLAKYQKVLKVGGYLKLKHDNLDFFCWSLESAVEFGVAIDELTFDLHDSDLNSDYKIKTTYERRWLEEGRKTYFFRGKMND